MFKQSEFAESPTGESGNFNDPKWHSIIHWFSNHVRNRNTNGSFHEQMQVTRFVLLLFPFYKSVRIKGRTADKNRLSRRARRFCMSVRACDDACVKEGKRWARGKRECVCVCVRACVRVRGEVEGEKDRKRDERTRGKQVRKKRENKREKEEKGSGGGRSSKNGGHWSHPPRTDRLSFSLPDSQVRLHNSQLLDRSLHIRDHRRPGRQRHHQ